MEHQTSDGLEVSPIEDDIQEKEVDCESNDETDTTSKRGKRIRKRKRKPASGNKPETQETNSVETIQKNVIEQPLKLFKESTSKSNSHIRSVHHYVPDFCSNKKKCVDFRKLMNPHQVTAQSNQQ